MKTPVRYGPHDKYVQVWGVETECKAGLMYTVARTAENVWSCGCPRWTRNASRPECKHIAHVKNFVHMRDEQSIPVAPMPEQVKKTLSRFALLEV